MDPESHDRAMATVSHVPTCFPCLLMELASREQEADQEHLPDSRRGFRDMTRIAASSPDMWLDIARENRAFIVERLKEYGQSVAWLLAVLEDGDDEALRTMFVDAAAAREELNGQIGDPVRGALQRVAAGPGRAGVISRITTAVGSIGINIEGHKHHAPARGETGILALKVLGEQSAAEASAHLRTLGYRATTGKV